jgi:hypothetical protein
MSSGNTLIGSDKVVVLAFAVALFHPLILEASGQDERQSKLCEGPPNVVTPVAIDLFAPRAAEDTSGRPIEFVATIVPPHGNRDLSPEDLGLQLQLRTSHTKYELTRDGWTYRRTMDPGRYVLEILSKDPRYCAPSRAIVVDPAHASLRVHLGQDGAFFYRQKRSLIPFLVNRSEIAIALTTPFTSEKEAARTLARIEAEALEWTHTPIKVSPSGEVTNRGYDYEVLNILPLPPSVESEQKNALLKELRKLLLGKARVGDLLRGFHSGERVADSRYVLKLPVKEPDPELKRTLESYGVRLVRRLDKESDLWLALFPGDVVENIVIIERLIASRQISLAEPDLVSFLRDDQLPAAWPNDGRYSEQFVLHPSRRGNHALQQVRDAWELLSSTATSNGAPLALADVYLATLDRGILLSDWEVNCSASDGTSQIYACFDAANGQTCGPGGHQLDTNAFGKLEYHGMMVFGIISACTNNAVAAQGRSGEIAGMAPGAHHIAVKRPASVGGVRYRETLLWLAGLDIECSPEDEPEDDLVPGCDWPPLPRAADVINCSHGEDDTSGELSEFMDSTLDRLVTEGRSGKGTVLVYSAGNSGHPVESIRPIAADPRTLAVANCTSPPSGQAERLASCSNFGDSIDVCALGEQAPAIAAACTNVSPPPPSCVVGCTSAATPQVTAAVGLILAANPTLQWDEVRDILRATAERAALDATAPNLDCSWTGDRSYCYGSGRLNVCQGVASALERRGVSTPENACAD